MSRNIRFAGIRGRTADRRIECSAKKNRGVNEAFTEAARVALQVKNVKGDKDAGCCAVM